MGCFFLRDPDDLADDLVGVEFLEEAWIVHRG
jgi:hypothetical protein